MHETLPLVLAWLAGTLLGVMFYGGLWLTIRRAHRPGAPVLWFPASFLLRTGVALAGIYFVGRDGGLALLGCLVGFVLARFWVAACIRPRHGTAPAGISRHASES